MTASSSQEWVQVGWLAIGTKGNAFHGLDAHGKRLICERATRCEPVYIKGETRTIPPLTIPDQPERCPYRWDGDLQCARPAGHKGVHRDGYKHAGGTLWTKP